MANISVQPVKAKREFDGKDFVLTKINYSEEDAVQDKVYHEERGRETRLVEEDGFWLLYTKIG